MAVSSLSEQDWRIRLAVYRFFVDHGRPPAYAELARQLDIPAEDVRQAYRRLHHSHALFLDLDADTIRMANPLSAVPTLYRVHVDGRQFWANCAWDLLGIPAMLQTDAQVEAVYAHSGDATTYAIVAGELEAVVGVVHFPVPFRRWYDDLIHT